MEYERTTYQDVMTVYYELKKHVERLEKLLAVSEIDCSRFSTQSLRSSPPTRST